MTSNAQQMNIADRMRELVAILHKEGVNDVKFPDAKPESEDGWHKNYAIIQDVYYDDFGWDDGARNYFDGAELISDLKQLTREHFADDLSVEVHFHGEGGMGVSEIEVYRNRGYRDGEEHDA